MKEDYLGEDRDSGSNGGREGRAKDMLTVNRDGVTTLSWWVGTDRR